MAQEDTIPLQKSNKLVEIEPDEFCSPEDRGRLPKINVRWYWGIDDTPVIEIDTSDLDSDAKGPVLRVWLNDDTIWENPPVQEV